jgi:hypothetical protein
MVRFPTLATLLLCVATTAAGADVPELGDPLPSDAKPTGEFVMTSPSQSRPGYSVSISGVDYTLCAESGRIVYISTLSRLFQTPEGVRVGDPFGQVREHARAEVRAISGWAFVVPLRSGWGAAFVQGETATEEPLRDEAPVRWLFRDGRW